jgi:hypothetical protein
MSRAVHRALIRPCSMGGRVCQTILYFHERRKGRGVPFVPRCGLLLAIRIFETEVDGV